MDLRHFRAFLAVAEDLHFARAAERLGITPPSLTAQIQELERDLAAELFFRTKRSVRLSPAGELFRPEAVAALRQVERAAATARRAGRGEAGRIAIGYVASSSYAGLLQRQIATFRQTHPDVELDVSEVAMARIVEMVDGGELDLGFVRSPIVCPPGLVYRVLFTDHFRAALPAGHERADQAGPIDPRALTGELFVPPEQPAGVEEVGRRGGFTPRLVRPPGNLVAVLTLVSLGVGVSIVPSSLSHCVTMADVVLRDIAGTPIPSELALVFRRSERQPAAKAFIAQTAALAP